MYKSVFKFWYFVTSCKRWALNLKKSSSCLLKKSLNEPNAVKTNEGSQTPCGYKNSQNIHSTKFYFSFWKKHDPCFNLQKIVLFHGNDAPRDWMNKEQYFFFQKIKYQPKQENIKLCKQIILLSHQFLSRAGGSTHTQHKNIFF